VAEPASLSLALARFADGVSCAALPEAVERSIRERLLDTIGLCLGAVPLDTSAMSRSVALGWGGPHEATTIGFGDRLPATGAGFVNGVLAHSLDFDDTHLPSVLHPSASVIPAALAAGEAVQASIEELIAAAAAGYEICIRTGMAAYDRELGNSIFFERGWHATSICGTLAAAAVGARLYGLGADGIGHALAIACSMGSGLIEANRAGGSVKRLHCGWAVHAGLIAAQCARAGLTGPPSALEGRFGFYQAFCSGRFFPDEILRGLGEEWCIPGIFYKPYPANHFTHAGIDAALRLRKRVDLGRIESLTLGVATPTVRTIGEPREEKARPRSGYHAQFSGPFTVAAALIGGGGLGVDLADFTDAHARDERYLSLAAKVTVIADPECDAIFPNQFPAVLRARLHDGTVLEEKVLANRGGPDHPLSREELMVKFLGNATRTISPERAQALANLVVDARGISVPDLMNATGPDPALPS
jgi:2-methylcitrate dehydratase PrpD